MVVTIDRGRYRVLLESTGEERHITAAKARQLGRMGVIVGDRVRLDGDVSGEEGTLARIVEVVERDTVLRRTADDDDPYERAIVANADQLVIVTALADPPPRVGMIDRILVAAFDAAHRAAAAADQGRPGLPRRARRRVHPARRAGPGDCGRAATSTSCAPGWPGTAPCSSGTPGSASRPWSTP